MKSCLKNTSTKTYFYFGFIVLLITYIPQLLLGTDSIVNYHDQLDGEIIAYIYQAKYLFCGIDVIPEFLNGAAKQSLTLPAPFAVLFFKFLSPFSAYLLLQFLGQTIAYSGMFLLTQKLAKSSFASCPVSLIVALLYTFIPFLPVYGLTQYGIPMLLCSFLYLYNKKHVVISYLYVAFYASMSSLVLCGFVWIISLSLLLVFLLITKKIKKHPEFLFSFLILLFAYTLSNLPLFAQFIGYKENFISHKTEYAIASTGFYETFLRYFLFNETHSTCNQIYILLGSVVLIISILFSYKYWSKHTLRNIKKIICLLLILLITYIIATLWSVSFVVQIRKSLGAIGAFQLTRVIWVTPALWYTILSLCLNILWSNESFLKRIRYFVSVPLVALLCLACVKSSFLKPCIQELLLPTYETISWSDYYALGVMNQVEEYIEQYDNKKISDYKVASLGIDPSAALYHGFYCVDGYSNNYNLNYKHAFRQVIEPELDKNEGLTGLFDNWGNRCYLFSSEIPGYYTVEKNSFWYRNLELDIDALKKLGCDYILSAAYIVNANQLNLTLLREEGFETLESYYKIFIYKLNP